MRAALAILVPLLCAGSVASAQAPAKAAKRVRNGRARRVAVADNGRERRRVSSTVEEAITSCLAMWEPVTHMTKRQWARACRRVAERLRDA